MERSLQIETVRQEWLDIKNGLYRTLQRAEVLELVRHMYRLAGHAAPSCVVVGDSPVAVNEAAVLIHRRLPEVSSWDDLRDGLPATLWALTDTPPDSTGPRTGSFSWRYCEMSGWCNFTDAVYRLAEAAVGHGHIESIRNRMWGKPRSWSYWTEPQQPRRRDVPMFRPLMGIDLWDEKLQHPGVRTCDTFFMTEHYTVAAALDAAARRGAALHVDCLKWIEFMRLPIAEAYFFEQVVLLCTLPTAARRDDRQRPHSRVGPAIEWADGQTTYCIHGVAVEAEAVQDPASLTVRRILEERNIEVRRVLVELKGAERFFAEAEAEVLHADADGAGMPRRLLRVALREDEPMVMVEVQCPSTGKKALLRVPPDTPDCGQAVAWTFSVEERAAYHPVVEA